MEIYINEYKKVSTIGCVLALGNFDGVHKAHARLLKVAREYADKNNLTFGIYTFYEHPKQKKDLLTTNDEKNDLFCLNGADFIYYENFSEVSFMTPEEFCQYICHKFNCICTVCGENFRFGAKAKGDSKLLISLMLSQNKQAIVIPTLKNGSLPISSTLIRESITKGNIETANSLLGYNFSFCSEVIHGANLGHKLGFPTINQIFDENKICPKFGVYASRVMVEDKEYNGVTNIGVKPTVTNDNRIIAETYIIDFDDDIYGKTAKVSLYKMLRQEEKFSSLDELCDNIRENVSQTKKYFEDTDI